MFNIEWPENLSIFLDNLCIYHVCFDLVSFFMIIFTWWFCKSVNVLNHNQTEIRDQNQTQIDAASDLINDDTTPLIKKEEKDEDDSKGVTWCDKENIVSNIKIMRQKALVKELKSKLTEDELEEERRTEKMQLEKIFQLLREQEEKFQMSSMEQLQDQLHLYM